MDAVLKVIGMEGRWTEGSLWNAGSCAIEHEGTKYNAALGWKTSEEQVQRCVDRDVLYLLPEPFDLGGQPLHEWTREDAPYLLGYHLNKKNTHEHLRNQAPLDVFVELALQEIPARARQQFEAQKYESANWLLFRTHTTFKRFGRVMSELCLGRLSDAENEGLWKWRENIRLAFGCDPHNPEMADLFRRANQALREASPNHDNTHKD